MIKFKKTEDGLMSILSEKDSIYANRYDILSLYNYLHSCIFTIHEVDREFVLSESGLHDDIMKHGCLFPIDSETLARRHVDLQ